MDEETRPSPHPIEKRRPWIHRAPSLAAKSIRGEYPEYPTGVATEPLLIGGGRYGQQFWRFAKGLVDKRRQSIDVWYESPATHIIRDPFTGVVLGVTAMVDGREVNIRARNGVIFTCGGFENNLEMIQNYTSLTECFAFDTQHNTGDGIRMACEIGAKLVNMDSVMGPYLGVYRPGLSRPKGYSGTNVSGSVYKGAHIMVGPDGTRFQDESYEPRHGYRYFCGTWVLSPAPSPCYLIFDQACLEQSAFISQSMAKDLTMQVEAGFVKASDTVAGLAGQIGIDPQALEATVGRYNLFCEEGVDYEFGRCGDVLGISGQVSEGLLVPFADGPYYAAELKPAIINTQGGPLRNEQGQIIDVNGQPIPHLYGAGELGTIFSSCYQGSGNLGDNVAFGRISGTSAAMPKSDNQSAEDLTVDVVTPMPKEPPVFETFDNECIGSAEGFCGTLYVKVKVAGDGTIEEVTVLDNGETDVFGGNAIAAMPSRFVGLQVSDVADVDGVSMATFTLAALRSAVADALSQL